MWGCNWGFPFMQGGWYMGHGPFGLLAGVLILGVVVYLIVFAVRTAGVRGRCSRDAGDSLEIIKTKFARGEITEEEYRRMKDILNG